MQKESSLSWRFFFTIFFHLITDKGIEYLPFSVAALQDR